MNYMKLQPLSQPIYNDFTTDYLFGRGAARNFFTYQPSLGGIEKAAKEYQDKQAVMSPDLLKQLSRFNQSLGSHQAVTRNLEALAEPNTLVIAAGQQPGLLTGSLHTIYKIIQVICLCQNLSRNGPTRYVPLFWTASNDHQQDQADHFQLQLPSGAIHRVALAYQENDKVPYFQVKTVPQFLTVVKENLIDHTQDTEFRQQIIDTLESSFNQADNLAEWFNLLLAHLFEAYGLVIFDPAVINVAAYAPQIFERMLREPELLHRLTEDAGELISAAGYTIQVPPKNNKLPFFIYEDGQRWEVTYADRIASFNNQAYSFERLAKIIADEPERVSPNVFLRALVQQALFRVVAFVGGPAETAYHAQLYQAYQALQLIPPVVIPRWQIFFSDPKCQRLIRRYQLSWDDLSTEPHRIIYQLLKKHHGAEIEPKCRQWTEEMEAQLEKLTSLMPEELPLWQQRVTQFKQRIEKEWQKLEQQGWAELKKQKSKLEQDLTYLHNAFFPNNTPAERIYNIFPLLIKYGPDFIPSLIQTMAQQQSGAYLIEWSG